MTATERAMRPDDATAAFRAALRHRGILARPFAPADVQPGGRSVMLLVPAGLFALSPREASALAGELVAAAFLAEHQADRIVKQPAATAGDGRPRAEVAGLGVNTPPAPATPGGGRPNIAPAAPGD